MALPTLCLLSLCAVEPHAQTTAAMKGMALSLRAVQQTCRAA